VRGNAIVRCGARGAPDQVAGRTGSPPCWADRGRS